MSRFWVTGCIFSISLKESTMIYPIMTDFSNEKNFSVFRFLYITKNDHHFSSIILIFKLLCPESLKSETLKKLRILNKLKKYLISKIYYEGSLRFPFYRQKCSSFSQVSVTIWYFALKLQLRNIQSKTDASLSWLMSHYSFSDILLLYTVLFQ